MTHCSLSEPIIAGELRVYLTGLQIFSLAISSSTDAEHVLQSQQDVMSDVFRKFVGTWHPLDSNAD